MLHRHLRQVLLLAFSFWVAAGASAAPADPATVLQALRDGGVAVLLRHAQTTPGVGDPAGWRLDDCSSQRNLDDTGRAQARRVGAWFRQHGLAPTVVRSSPWCRTRETALLAFGRSEDWPALSNRHGQSEPAPEQFGAPVRAWMAGLQPGQLAVLVSHGSSINAIVGTYLAPAEAVVVRARRGADGELAVQVVGRLAVP